MRRCPACNGWRHKDGQISLAAREPIEGDLAIAHRGKLTAEKIRRGTMFGCRPVGVDNANPRAGLKRGNEIVEQSVGLGDLVIRVHQKLPGRANRPVIPDRAARRG